MSTYVYVDLFFLINFSMDYICLYISGKVLRHKVSAKKYILSSLIGGLYSVASLFMNVNSVIAFVIDILVCIIMVAICFFSKREGVSKVLVTAALYVGVSMLLGGVMTAIFGAINKLNLDLDILADDGLHTYSFAIIAIISAILSIGGISFITKKSRHREYFVKISINGKTLTLLGFVDTGNLVRDQISGKSIIFIDREAAKGVIDPDAEKKFLAGEVLYKSSRLIPVSGAQGCALKLAFSPDSVTLTEKKSESTPEFAVDCLVSPTDIKADFGAIIPDDIISLDR